MNVTKPGPGGRGTIRVRESINALTWRQTRALQVRQRHHPTRAFLVCNGGGRFHGGQPMNGFSTQIGGRNSNAPKGF